MYRYNLNLGSKQKMGPASAPLLQSFRQLRSSASLVRSSHPLLSVPSSVHPVSSSRQLLSSDAPPTAHFVHCPSPLLSSAASSLLARSPCPLLSPAPLISSLTASLIGSTRPLPSSAPIVRCPRPLVRSSRPLPSSALPLFALLVRNAHQLPSSAPVVRSPHPLPSSAPLVLCPQLLLSSAPLIRSPHPLPHFPFYSLLSLFAPLNRHPVRSFAHLVSSLFPLPPSAFLIHALRALLATAALLRSSRSCTDPGSSSRAGEGAACARLAR